MGNDSNIKVPNNPSNAPVQTYKNTRAGVVEDTQAVALVDYLGIEKSTEINPLLVGAPYTLADYTNKYGVSSRYYGNQVAGSGAVSFLTNEGAIKLAVTGTNGDSAKLRTNTYFKNQAGKGLTARISVINNDAGQANQTRRWGYYDDNDGVFWELNGTTFNIKTRTSVSGSPADTAVAQTSWNYDKMDGSAGANNPSGLTLDLTKGHEFEITITLWGAGLVRFYVDGNLVHVQSYVGALTTAFLRTGQLPLQWEIVNTGASTGSFFKYTVASVKVYGGQLPQQYAFGVYTPAGQVVGQSEIPVLSIRVQNLLNSITNRTVLIPKMLGISSFANRAGFRLVWNGTLTGPTFNAVDADSGAEFDIAATALSGGLTLLRGLTSSPDDGREVDLSNIFGYLDRNLKNNAFGTAGAQDILTVMAVAEVNQGNATVKASLAWGEVQ